jgi:hypothetical protein
LEFAESQQNIFGMETIFSVQRNGKTHEVSMEWEVQGSLKEGSERHPYSTGVVYERNKEFQVDDIENVGERWLDGAGELTELQLNRAYLSALAQAKEEPAACT